MRLHNEKITPALKERIADIIEDIVDILATLVMPAAMKENESDGLEKSDEEPDSFDEDTEELYPESKF
jgi:hypothetical protein